MWRGLFEGKLNFNGVNNMNDERYAKIDGVFGAPWLGILLLANSEGKSLGSMVATEIAERLERLGLAPLFVRIKHTKDTR
jgi:surfactin synthase thioesterase subunit